MTLTPRILCVDPGGVTGWCYSDIGRIETGTITRNTPANRFPQNHVRNSLVSLRAKYHPDQVIVERMPLRLQPWLREIVEACNTVFPNAHLIGPGEWKPVTGKLKLPNELRNKTIHERDAYRMGRYYLFRFWDGFLDE